MTTLIRCQIEAQYKGVSEPYLEKEADQLLALVEQREAALLKAVEEKVIGKYVELDGRFDKGTIAWKIDRGINEFKAEERKALAKLQEGEK